jgi:hypothetical protein
MDVQRSVTVCFSNTVLMMKNERMQSIGYLKHLSVYLCHYRLFQSLLSRSKT